jgi:hypothetical protein
LIRPHPKAFDLAEREGGFTDRTNTNAPDRVTVEARDEKESEWGHQLIYLKMGPFVAAFVAAIQFVDGGVVDAERTVRRYGFVVNDEI